MDFENEKNDRLQFQHLAGGDIIQYPPLFAQTGEHLLMLSNDAINIYSTVSGQFVRRLEGASSPLVDCSFELDNDDMVVACSQSGEVLTWLWKTGELKSNISLSIEKGVVTNFKLLNIYGKSNLSHAFVCIKAAGSTVAWRLVDRETGRQVPVPLNLKLTAKTPLIAVDNKNFPNLAIVQGFHIFFVNYVTWQSVRLFNAHKTPMTMVQVHPTEECFATGDEIGRIFLWRQFMGAKEVKTSLYHWHHTKVTSICFTASGANFFSSGEEAVLVKWNVDNPMMKQFMPRMPSRIQHIVVSPDNSSIAVCTMDNAVQIVGPEHKILSNLQEFTFIADDKTGNYKFPVGLRLNPRTNTLVLNGRMGSLQFYNTYTRSLLYNLNIVNQNLLSVERDRILYDIHVTKAAFNIDWLATGEVFNDHEHLPELRLKFWQYQEESQSYALNTNIELPHEGGFKAIEFSNDYQVDNLLCATVGENNIIKIWCLEDSDNIYKEGKTWYCIAQTSYRNLSVESICFSQDGSLLAAGYGNTLCVYKSDNLKLKAALTGANGMDGCVNKTQVRVAMNNMNGAEQKELKEKRERLMKLFTNCLELNEETLIKELQRSVADRKTLTSEPGLKPVEKLDNKQKMALYQRVLQMHELSLFQKVMIYQKLGIGCKVHPQMATRMAEYIQAAIKERSRTRQIQKLKSQLHQLSVKERFKAKYRLDQYAKRQYSYDVKINNNLVPLMSFLNLQNVVKTNEAKPIEEMKAPSNLNTAEAEPPRPTLAEIRHVQFAAGEYGHLVTVCTEKRVLIWNLLTLRLQSVLKISAKHLSFDPQTNLIAVVTNNNELHVFQPNVPLPIYQRSNIPDLHGLAWVPRRFPKQRSINLDWQAQSTLYFLTEQQKIIYLSSPSEKQQENQAPVVFNKPASESMAYTTFGSYAVKSVNAKQTTAKHSGPLVLGNSDKTAVKALIDMSTHTMPPMSLMCEDFLKSMVKSISVNNDRNSSAMTDGETSTSDVLQTRLNGDGHLSASDNEEDAFSADGDGDVKMTNGYARDAALISSAAKVRKYLMRKKEELKRQQTLLETASAEELQANPAQADEQEMQLRFIAKQSIKLEI